MKKGFFLITIVVLLTLPTLNLQGQESDCCDPLFIIGARFHKAFIIQHSKKLKDELTQTNPWSIEMDVNWHLRKRGVWDYCYCYPRTGIAFKYINFDFPEVMGSAIAVFPFIEPYIRADRNLNFSVQFGLGPAYLTKVYDAKTNPDNLFFSSPISFITQVNFAVNYRMTDQLSLRLAANFHHISNGGISEPNLGMNFPSVNAGLDYSFQKNIFENRVKDPHVDLNPKKNRFDFTVAFAAQPTPYTPESQLYPVFCLGTNYSRVLGRIFAMSAGVEWMNDRSTRAKIIEDDLIDEATRELYDHKQIGATAGIEWLFGRFIFYQQFGTYLYSPYVAKHKVYQRYGLSFKINDYLFTGVNIKAHAQNADFLDFRIGLFF